MSRIAHIVAATDFSPRAELAVKRAATLAQQHEATLHLLHVMPKLQWQMFGRALVDHPLVTEGRLYESARARLKNLAEALAGSYAIALQHHVSIGRPHEKIAEYARSHVVDLTVLGSHGENFVLDPFIGTTALKFVRMGTSPALIVDTEATGAYGNVLVAVDFSDVSRAAVEAALRIGSQGSIRVLHVYEVEFEEKMRFAGVEDGVIQRYRDAAAREARRMMDAFLAGKDLRDRVSPIIKRGAPALTILDQAQALHADLIVMGKRGRTELNEVLLGSVTKHVLQETDRDLLLVGHFAA
ncbi:MAG: universal stress protein [Candidatus Methylophosphatis roskildensis]